MRFYRVTFLFAVTFVLSGTPAFAADIQASLDRMDTIIKEMQALRAEFAALFEQASQQPHTPAVLGATTKKYLTQDLSVGATNSDIERIQRLLARDSEIYGHGVISGFYGPKTEEAIKNLQSRFGLSPVGVTGPATRELLELFFNTYPDEVYPEGVLLKKPTVLGISTTKPLVPAIVTVPITSVSTISEIVAHYDGEEAEVKIKYTDGTRKTIDVEGDSKLKVIDAVALALGEKKATILGVIEFTSANDDEDEDEDDEDEDEDDEEDDDEEIDSITARIEDGETEVEVEYENGDDEEFTVEEDKESEIIEEIADELNIDEDEVEDVIEFEYEPMDSIDVTVEDGKALAIVTFEDGTEKRIKVSSDDEDEIIEAIAEELDEDEEDVEDIIEFDFVE